ncbi:MAG: outer membrane protein transport protein [Rhodocyclaceae bacterium]|nr:outer membrane protein transport protein [Rhodocyclaceae bacterium]
MFGWGITAGAIWKPNSKMQLGISWSSKQKMSDFEWNTAQGKVSMRMDAPQTFAFGIAFKPTSDLLIEADVKRIWFANVLDVVPVNRPAGSPVPAAFNFGWSNQTVYAIGVQKDIGGMMQIRTGFNYGKSPIGPEDVNQNFGSLAVVEKHLTFGLSRKFSDKVIGSLSALPAIILDTELGK